MGEIAQEAFSFYESLGSRRSYTAVEEHYGVSRRTVTRCALRERWQARLREREAASVHEPLEARKARHLACLALLKEKALKCKRRIPYDEMVAIARRVDRAAHGPRRMRSFNTATMRHG